MMFVIFLIGCAEPKFTMAGEVALEGYDLTGSLVAATAFAHAQDGTLGAYISSSPDTTCDDVVSLLSDLSFDPSSMFLAGHCNLFVFIDSDYDSAGFAVEDDLIYGVSSSMGCTLGEGEYTWEPQSSYTWRVQWWQVAPTSFSYDFSDALNIGLSELNGSFSQDGQLVSVPATATISGLATAESCPGLADTYLFD